VDGQTDGRFRMWVAWAFDKLVGRYC